MGIKRYMIAGCAAVALMVGSSVAMAAGQGQSAQASSANQTVKQHCMQKKLKHQMRGLTDQQRAEVKQIMQQTRATALPIKQQLKAKQAMLNAVLMQKDIDVKQANSLVQEINGLQGKLLQTAVDTRIEISNKVGIKLGLREGHKGHHCKGGYAKQ